MNFTSLRNLTNPTGKQLDCKLNYLRHLFFFVPSLEQAVSFFCTEKLLQFSLLVFLFACLFFLRQGLAA